MIIDDLKESLKQLAPALQAIKEYWKNADLEKEFTTLEAQTLQENFWQNKDQASILQKFQHLKTKRGLYLHLIDTYAYYAELLEMPDLSESDIATLEQDIKNLIKDTKNFKVSLLLDKPHDQSACFLNINAGAGGTESQDWANILLRMYLRFCERNKFAAQIIDIQQAEEAGIKSATLYITGANTYGMLKTEQGVHRLVRVSPFDANKRRHTSFAAVDVTPELPDIHIEINPEDLRIDTYRAGGAGGQHVNKTESAVRITHIPTGLVTQCQSQRSQFQNKEVAFKMLKAKLIAHEEEIQRAKTAGQTKQKIEWGSQIRSYVLHPYKMVKDHRTDIEHMQPDLVLDGDLMDFIEAELIRLAGT